MSIAFPINPNAGKNDGNPEDDVMPEFPDDTANSETTPDGADRGGATEGGIDGANAEDLPYSWKDLDDTEAEADKG
jgi:hypothetical protein